MRKSFLIGPPIVALMLAASTVAHADERNDKVRIGMGLNVGVPGGAAVGVVVNPKLDWLRVELDLTYNYLSFGGRASVQLDPMAEILIRSHTYLADGTDIVTKNPFGFGIFADVQGGFFPTAGVPGHSDLPQLGYDYLNMYLGMRLGNPNGFHWVFEAGPTYMYARTNNFAQVVGNVESGLTLGNPSAKGWVTPTGMTGFRWTFAGI
jgi:hypothetical protein